MLERVVYKSVFVSDHDMAGVHHRDGDCRKAFEALKSRGVKFETGVLRVGLFQDLDGDRLQLRDCGRPLIEI
jgi:hypothetical protein